MLKNKKILYAAIGVCVILAGIFYYIGRGGKSGGAYETKAQSGMEFSTTALQTEAVTEGKVCIYVCGQVNTPGVYYLKTDARIADAIEAAGGATELACIQLLNLADSITDGQRIYVPSEDETGSSLISGSSAGNALVNINTADISQLTTLPGIGESRAQSIIAYREENGAYGAIEDIMNVSGIKESAFSKIKDYICV